MAWRFPVIVGESRGLGEEEEVPRAITNRRRRQILDQQSQTLKRSSLGAVADEASGHGDDDEDIGEGGDPSGGDRGRVSASNVLCSCLRFGVSIFLWRSPPENSSGPYI
jgi:hypothetical protein